MTEQTKTPKTLAERLEAAKALVSKLQAQVDAEAVLNSISTGNVVVFAFGRGEKRRELTGVVAGLRDDEKQGRLAAIQAGEGFDAQTYKVRVADILRIVEAEGSEDAAQGVEGDPLENA